MPINHRSRWESKARVGRYDAKKSVMLLKLFPDYQAASASNKKFVIPAGIAGIQAPWMATLALAVHFLVT